MSGEEASLSGRRLPETCAMQSAHRKALDVLNSLGLSDGLLKVIDRRQRMDRIVVYGGMVCLAVLVSATLHALLPYMLC